MDRRAKTGHAGLSLLVPGSCAQQVSNSRATTSSDGPTSDGRKAARKRFHIGFSRCRAARYRSGAERERHRNSASLRGFGGDVTRSPRYQGGERAWSPGGWRQRTVAGPPLGWPRGQGGARPPGRGRRVVPGRAARRPPRRTAARRRHCCALTPDTHKPDRLVLPSSPAAGVRWIRTTREPRPAVSRGRPLDDIHSDGRCVSGASPWRAPRVPVTDNARTRPAPQRAVSRRSAPRAVAPEMPSSAARALT
jgi:hypothetical protein